MLPVLAATALAALLVLSGCASPLVPPTQELQAAEAAITTAEQARVADYASPELGEARVKLTAAQAAVQKAERQEDMLQAKRLAEQSKVDAELALAKANAAKARTVNSEMIKSTDVIKQEMQRNPGVQQ